MGSLKNLKSSHPSLKTQTSPSHNATTTSLSMLWVSELHLSHCSWTDKFQRKLTRKFHHVSSIGSCLTKYWDLENKRRGNVACLQNWTSHWSFTIDHHDLLCNWSHPISWSKTIGFLQKDSKGSKQSKPCATAWSSFKKSGPAPHVYLEMEWILDRELDGTEFEWLLTIQRGTTKHHYASLLIIKDQSSACTAEKQGGQQSLKSISRKHYAAKQCKTYHNRCHDASFYSHSHHNWLNVI